MNGCMKLPNHTSQEVLTLTAEFIGTLLLFIQLLNLETEFCKEQVSESFSRLIAVLPALTIWSTWMLAGSHIYRKKCTCRRIGKIYLKVGIVVLQFERDWFEGESNSQILAFIMCGGEHRTSKINDNCVLLFVTNNYGKQWSYACSHQMEESAHQSAGEVQVSTPCRYCNHNQRHTFLVQSGMLLFLPATLGPCVNIDRSSSGRSGHGDVGVVTSSPEARLRVDCGGMWNWSWSVPIDGSDVCLPSASVFMIM